MNKEFLTQKVIELLSNRGIDGATPECNMVVDLGMDSLDRVELEMDVEKEFNVKVPDFKSEEWVTVDDVVNLVLDLLPKKLTNAGSNSTIH